MSNVRWWQIVSGAVGLLAVGGIIWAGGEISAQGLDNKAEIEEQALADLRLRMRVTATETNQAVVAERTANIQRRLGDLTRKIDANDLEISNQLADILRSLQ